ncbi:MAG: molybdopterin molybdotransferase MoeA [Bacteroidota bacterium]
MISVNEAVQIIQAHQPVFKKEKKNLADAEGRVLAEEVLADRDLPPFHRVAMDGIAIRHESLRKGNRNFPIASTQVAGKPPASLDNPLLAMEVMTGAVLPPGTDTVVRYEDVLIDRGVATVHQAEVEPGQHIHHQGQDAREGQRLLSPGIMLSAAEIAVLASVGLHEVDVFGYPRTAIISTGDELVAIEAQPLPWQIRRSNSYALQAALKQLRHEATLFHLPDHETAMEDRLKNIFESYELVLLSGGVSKGKFDYVPQVLKKLGIEKRFHQVSQRPGKPFWFGTSPRHTVFALPGNPVSTYLCFFRYVKPWLLRCAGVDAKPTQARLATDFTFAAPLTYFLQVRVQNENGVLMAYPDAGGGSGDFANLKNVDGFLELSAERTDFKKGEPLPYWPFRT